MFKCGLSEVVVTPKLGSPIPGSVNERFSTGTRDDLYAKSAVIETESATVAFIALDAIDVPRWLVERVRARVNESTGIPAEHVMVTSTHTHTGGPTIKTSFVNAVDETYLNNLADKAADAAIMAYSRRTEARIGFGRGHEADIAFNRRFRMQDGTVRMNPGIGNPHIVESVGTIDPEVLVIRIDDAAGKPLGVVTNYACHACVIPGTEYSGDYPGHLSRSLKQLLGQHVVSLFFPGACGDINHIDVSGRFPTTKSDHYQTMGSILAGEALKVRAKAQPAEPLQLQVKSAYVPVRFRQPTAEQLAEAERVLGLPEKEAPVSELKFARQLLQMSRGELGLPDEAEAEIQAFALGDLAIVGLPAEIFVEFGLQIKRGSPFAVTIVNELTNGSVSGYVCTQEAYRQGGYETRLRPYSRLQEEAGDMFVKHALQLLHELKAASAL